MTNTGLEMMNTLPPNNTDPRMIEEQFEVFWQNFDPNFRYNQKTKEFVRQLWEVARNYNLQQNNYESGRTE